MKWYNKPITWKAYGIMCLASVGIGMVGMGATILIEKCCLRKFDDKVLNGNLEMEDDQSTTDEEN